MISCKLSPLSLLFPISGAAFLNIPTTHSIQHKIFAQQHFCTEMALHPEYTELQWLLSGVQPRPVKVGCTPTAHPFSLHLPSPVIFISSKNMYSVVTSAKAVQFTQEHHIITIHRQLLDISPFFYQ
jgi:hypothetical protein